MLASLKINRLLGIVIIICCATSALAGELPQACGVGTYSRLVAVNSTSSLKAALTNAQAGDLINLADGLYKGNFVVSVSGTSSAMITLCGGKGAILDGGSLTSGYTLHLKANYVRLAGFSVTRGKNGIILDRANNNILTGLSVYNTGNEAVHLRTFSSNNVIESSEISNAGRYTASYGEGIYIGSAHSNWCTYTGCEPDKSDNNKILNNHIFGNYAESIDIKEGTSHTLVEGNTLDGTAITGANYADSWIDVKGNDVLVKNNIGNNKGSILLDGYQTHVPVAGWGERIVFAGNKSFVNGKGYGINVNKSIDVTVYCDNEVTGAEKGLSNVACVAPPESSSSVNVNIAGMAAVIYATPMRADHPIDRLFDRCSKDDVGCMAGTNSGSLMEVEMDFKSLHSIGSVKLFGDANGNWVSTKFDIEYKVLASDAYKVIASGIPAFQNDWIRQSTTGLKARYIKVRVHGDAGKNAVQARELEVWGRPVDSSTTTEPVPVPSSSDLPVLSLNSFSSTYPGTQVSGVSVKYIADQKYDDYAETKLDIFTIDPAQKTNTPLVLFVHGGGFRSGDKTDSHGLAKNFLAKGVAFATVNYRMLTSTPQTGKNLLLPLHDSRRSLQFIRHYAKALNIDTNKIVLVGSSAGASTVLWIGLQNDLRNLSSADPVLRQSTRVTAIAVSNTQATLDIYRWGTDVEFKGLYADGTANAKTMLKNGDVYYANTGTPISSYSQYLSEPWASLRGKLDVINFMDSGDPEIYAENSASATDLLHSYYHVDRLYAAATAKGVSGVYKTPVSAKAVPNGKAIDSSLMNFIFRKFGL